MWSLDRLVHCTAIACCSSERSFSCLLLSLSVGKELGAGGAVESSNGFFHDGIKQDLLL